MWSELRTWNARNRPLVNRLLMLMGWLVLISIAHYRLNNLNSDARVIKIGYMPVITNLAAPLLDHASKGNEDVVFQALKFASFAEMAEALRNDEIQVAFMIAPLSVVMRQQGEDVRVVLIGNRHESSLVARKDLNITSVEQLAGHTVAVPMRFSGHNLSIQQLIEKNNLEGKVKVVEMNPPDMAAAMVSGVLDAYYVGEPFAAQTLYSGHASLVHHVEDVWPKFICNLVLVRNQLVEEDGELVQKMVDTAARSGVWAEKHPEEVAKIASRYWNQTPEVIYYALTNPEDRVRYNLYEPREEEMQEMADMMVDYGLIESNDVTGLVENRFARAANLEGAGELDDIAQ